MNFGDAGMGGLVVVGIILWVLPVIVTIWVLVTLARMRSLLERIANRLDDMARRGTPLV